MGISKQSGNHAPQTGQGFITDMSLVPFDKVAIGVPRVCASLLTPPKGVTPTFVRLSVTD